MDLQREYTNKNLEEEHQRNRNRINSIAQYEQPSHICAGTAGVLRSPEATHICAGETPATAPGSAQVHQERKGRNPGSARDG